MKPFHFIRFLIALITAVTLITGAQPMSYLPDDSVYECWGKGIDGLQPFIRIETNAGVWRGEIDFMAEGDFSTGTWFLVTNSVGAKLKLTRADGMDIPLKDSSAKAAWQLPSVESRGRLMAVMRRIGRGVENHLLWQTDTIGSIAGQTQLAYSFTLKNCFEIPGGRPLILEVSPLIYRATNRAGIGRLVEFATVKIMLSTNGSARQLGELFSPERNVHLPASENTMHRVLGGETDGLEPAVYLYNTGSSFGWEVSVGIRFARDFPQSQLLRARNNLGATLHLWLANGAEVSSDDSDLKMALRFPKALTNLDTVETLFRQDGPVTTIGSFGLRGPFNIVLTNNALLQIAPLIYKLDTNTHVANLVNFQPIRIKLDTDGSVQQVK